MCARCVGCPNQSSACRHSSPCSRSIGKNRAAPAACSCSAMLRWLSAMTSSSVGKPKAQRSHEVPPAAPAAQSACAISSAMLDAPTSTRQSNGACCAKVRMLSVCGAVLPITTVTDQGCRLLSASRCNSASVWLSLSTPPRFTNTFCRQPAPCCGLFNAAVRHRANSSRNKTYCVPASTWQSGGRQPA